VAITVHFQKSFSNTDIVFVDAIRRFCRLDDVHSNFTITISGDVQPVVKIVVGGAVVVRQEVLAAENHVRLLGLSLDRVENNFVVVGN